MSLRWGASAKFVVTSHLPPIFHSVCMTSNYTILVHDHGKNQENPHQPLVFTNPRGLAARVAAICPSPHCFQPPRAYCPPGYLTQDLRGERSRSLISTVAAAKATKPADDSGDDNNNNEKDDVRSIDKKGNDGGDDEQGVKEGGVLAAAKAAKPGGDDSEDDDDDKERMRTTRRCKKVAISRGTKMMTPPLPWALVAHGHHLMKYSHEFYSIFHMSISYYTIFNTPYCS
jgi:hypothetical protein